MCYIWHTFTGSHCTKFKENTEQVQAKCLWKRKKNQNQNKFSEEEEEENVLEIERKNLI